MTRALYLSYDGMCDPLGGAQVLPYLFGLARRGHDISLISFEKPERSAAERAAVQQACEAAGIAWHPLPYHKRPPVLSAMYDLRRMHRAARRLHRERPFDLVHCRSYLPSLVGLRMKRQLGTRFIFDMRGFWADERVDGRLWNLGNPLFRAVYAFFKRKESEFLAEADAIVSLTEAGEKILRSMSPARELPITVIPCCVDFAAFPAVTDTARTAAREKLGIAKGARVAVYLGSFGSWYMVDQMMDFFRVQLERDPGAIFLFISRDPPAQIMQCAASRGVPAGRLIVRPASRSEVPQLAAAADYGLFFIMPVFSKKASSPTKMGELLALELPVVANGDVGDVARIVDESGAGVVVDRFNDRAYRDALDALDALDPDMDRWRAVSRRWFDLDEGVARYDGLYRKLARGTEPTHGG
jgi:glycosyltransferase involved in cell wall biosynthesis